MVLEEATLLVGNTSDAAEDSLREIQGTPIHLATSYCPHAQQNVLLSTYNPCAGAKHAQTIRMLHTVKSVECCKSSKLGLLTCLENEIRIIYPFLHCLCRYKAVR